MKKEVGLWIDRRKAIIVTITHLEDGIRSIQSTLEKQTCFPGVLSQEGWGGNLRDRKPGDYLTLYYDDVIAQILDADSIQIFGPGEEKIQLANRLRRDVPGERIVAVETETKMTERQIEAKVWQHFLSGPHSL